MKYCRHQFKRSPDTAVAWIRCIRCYAELHCMPSVKWTLPIRIYNKIRRKIVNKSFDEYEAEHTCEDNYNESTKAKFDAIHGDCDEVE